MTSLPRLALAACATFVVLPTVAMATEGAPRIAEGSSRIVGGVELTSVADNPGVVGVHVKGGAIICGGVRIHPEWAITAKHCFDKNLSHITSMTLQVSKGPKIAIAKAYPHPGKIDLTLLKLDKPGPGPILTWTDQQPAVGDTVTAWGWGLVDTVNRAKNLKKATGVVKSITTNPIYTEATDVVYAPGDGLCWQGDSGGPLTDAKGRLVGVSSWSDGYGTMKGTCGYVSLSTHAGWVTEVTGLKPNVSYPAIPDVPAPTPTTAPAPAPAPTPAPSAPAPTTAPAPTPTSAPAPAPTAAPSPR